MKKILLVLVFLLAKGLSAQEKKLAFDKGEWLKYRIHYGIVNAGYASLTVDEVKNKEKDLFHFKGKGWTTGMASWFFKVRDTYESVVDKKSQLPIHFIRRVDEGGYIINRDTYFDHEKKVARIEDHKHKTKKEIAVYGVQDMISAFYSLRNEDIDSLAIGDSVELDMFFDAEKFPFKLKYLGKETLSTKFGKVECYMLRPLVQSGRVFKAKESLTLWVSSDANKIPIRIKASLAVGSIKVDLHQYKGLSHPFHIIL
ncbi:DUF3108 domain-containing protein [Flavicella sediminum]|uniref:DUF3108 domain-containing protein n=1 Tax=Flavicella sediminum TaxID=2585141 RepID=UPI00111F08CB|nr:DUF3108 domain-containing protein [Flavicella sediminum]